MPRFTTKDADNALRNLTEEQLKMGDILQNRDIVDIGFQLFQLAKLDSKYLLAARGRGYPSNGYPNGGAHRTEFQSRLERRYIGEVKRYNHERPPGIKLYLDDPKDQLLFDSYDRQQQRGCIDAPSPSQAMKQAYISSLDTLMDLMISLEELEKQLTAEVVLLCKYGNHMDSTIYSVYLLIQHVMYNLGMPSITPDPDWLPTAEATVGMWLNHPTLEEQGSTRALLSSIAAVVENAKKLVGTTTEGSEKENRAA
ncbi:hypothetical protein BDZ91DRAFT_799033 [Kalaharituber pfeilii]|nr:hypothetical protein BDZ91DRAFT_799033 [Kalaharituber pfeilii]